MSNFCENCGAKLTEGDKFCEQCGSPMSQSIASVPESITEHNEQKSVAENHSSRKYVIGVICAALIFALGVAYATTGFFVVQPLEDMPDGVTIMYWRGKTKAPFISSADGLLLQRGDGVSIMGRLIVLAAAADSLQDKIIARLPYFDWMYLVSTGGQRFEQ